VAEVGQISDLVSFEADKVEVDRGLDPDEILARAGTRS